MSEVMVAPEPGVEKEKSDIDSAVKNLMDILDPEGPYRWDLPEKVLEVGDEGYDYFVCRTSTYLGLLYAFRAIIDKGLLPREQENALSDSLANLEAVKRKPGLRTQEDMAVLRDQFTKALMALMEASV